jgi:enoyl-CoA hydratase/carnithine racemase
VAGDGSTEPVLLETTADRVRVLTLNRPAQRNALSSPLTAALSDALDRADTDDDVGVVVLTGTDPAFCAGVDLKEAARDGAAYFSRPDLTKCITQVARMARPIIGAINGAAITGGLEIALGCDFLIASERAIFADTHARVGVLPGGGMTARLPGAIGLRRARRLSMTGDVIDAHSAERWGLVTEVVAHGRLLERTMEIARSVAEIEPATVGSIKRMYTEGSATTVGEALELEQTISRARQPDFAQLASRRDAVMRRNRDQLRDR